MLFFCPHIVSKRVPCYNIHNRKGGAILDLQQELWELNVLSPVDEFCYDHYCKTGHYMENPSVDEIIELMKRASIYTSANKNYVAQILSEGEINKLRHILYWENLSFKADHDTLISKSIRYFNIPEEHSHDYFEIECVIKGCAVHQSGQERFDLKEGDMVLIPPKSSHNLFVVDDGTVVNIGIRFSTFQYAFREILENGLPIAQYFQRAMFGQKHKEIVFRKSIDPFVLELLLMMYRQQKDKTAYANRINNHLVQSLVYYVAQNCRTNTFIQADERMDHHFIDIEMYILDNYRTITLEKLAAHFNLTTAYLSKMIKKHWGATFSELVQSVRIEKAKELLASTKMRIAEIGTVVGYEDESYFISIFKKRCGITPGKYRKQSALPMAVKIE